MEEDYAPQEELTFHDWCRDFKKGKDPHKSDRTDEFWKLWGGEYIAYCREHNLDFEDIGWELYGRPTYPEYKSLDLAIKALVSQMRSPDSHIGGFSLIRKNRGYEKFYTIQRVDKEVAMPVYAGDETSKFIYIPYPTHAITSDEGISNYLYEYVYDGAAYGQRLKREMRKRGVEQAKNLNDSYSPEKRSMAAKKAHVTKNRKLRGDL